MEDLEFVSKLCHEIKNEIEKYEDYVSERLMKKSIQLLSIIQDCSDEVKKEFSKELESYVNSNKEFQFVWIYSLTIHLTYEESRLVELLNLVITSNKLKANTKYFLYYQIKSLIFRFPILETENIITLEWKLLIHIFDLFGKEITTSLEPITEIECDQECALVLTEQVLAVQHGPTKTAFDRCQILSNSYKKVLLFNTAEILSQNGEIPFCNKVQGNYIESLSSTEKITWKDSEFNYIQFEKNMPDIASMNMILNYIRKLRPKVIISIGGSSIVAGFINKIIPVLCIGLTTSGLEITLVDYQLSPLELNQKYKNVLTKLGKSDDHIITGRFTFSLLEQKNTISRSQIGLPESAFLLVVVGARLTTEISLEFIEMLQKVLSEDVKLVIVGNLENFKNLKSKYTFLKDNAFYLGFCDDILSIMEICDLYINPIRKGGGTSCVEAMVKGKPVLSTTYGDVAGIVGKDFTCNNYLEMEKLIKKYMSDPFYYEEQSRKALQLSKNYLDSEREFNRIIKEYISRRNKKTMEEL